MSNYFSSVSTKALAVAALLALSSTAAMADEAADWPTFTASIAVTSDYRFRGISQNDREPIPQAAINMLLPEGFYAGLWTSGVNFLDNVGGKGGTSYEVDFIAGKNTDLGFGNLNIQGVYYSYPDHNRAGGAVRYSYFEAIGQLSIPFDALTITGSGAYSPDFFAETGTSWAAWGTAAFTANEWLALSGNVGHQWVNTVLPEYTYWDIGATVTYKSFALDVRYVDTDHNAGSCVAYTAGRPSWCNSGVIATLTYNINPFPW